MSCWVLFKGNGAIASGRDEALLKRFQDVHPRAKAQVCVTSLFTAPQLIDLCGFKRPHLQNIHIFLDASIWHTLKMQFSPCTHSTLAFSLNALHFKQWHSRVTFVACGIFPCVIARGTANRPWITKPPSRVHQELSRFAFAARPPNFALSLSSPRMCSLPQ